MQNILRYPDGDAIALHDASVASLECEGYYSHDAKFFNEPILVPKEISTPYFFRTVIFNTEERKKIYLQYNLKLSGTVYTMRFNKDAKNRCDEKVKETLQ